MRIDYLSVIIEFVDGVGEYIIDPLENEGITFIRNIQTCFSQFKSTTQTIITSSMYIAESSKVTIKASYITGTAYSGSQTVNIIVISKSTFFA